MIAFPHPWPPSPMA